MGSMLLIIGLGFLIAFAVLCCAFVAVIVVIVKSTRSGRALLEDGMPSARSGGSVFRNGLVRGVVQMLRNRPAAGTTFSSVPARRARLLTPTEEQFYRVLRLALPSGTHLLAKVRLKDLLEFDERSREGRLLFNQCSQKHVDFVVVGDADCLPLVVIELDDWTHRRVRNQKGDGVKDAMCAHAGLPLLRVGVSPYYNEAAINLRIREAIAGAVR